MVHRGCLIEPLKSLPPMPMAESEMKEDIVRENILKVNKISKEKKESQIASK